MKNDDKNKKPATTETQKRDETQKFSVSEEFSDSVVARNEELEQQVRRVLADYQNLEKRVAQERSNWIRTANKDLLLRLFPVFDTLMMATKHIDDKGLKLSLQQFHDALKNEGVVKIETLGKDFNPGFMECINTVEGEDGKVVEEVRTGFMMHDQVLRPAQVKVGKASN